MAIMIQLFAVASGGRSDVFMGLITAFYEERGLGNAPIFPSAQMLFC